ncbi:MAG: PepSY-like domain-containing protein [Acidobacteria bacterium]|nr:PepSY-like domain-containing protein [Acidobacteriota bacterium]
MKLSSTTAALAILMLASGASAQEKKVTKSEVPAPVLAAFAKMFPKSQAIAYAQEKEAGKTFYEVESKEGTIHRDVTFEPDGKLVVVEEEVAVKDLPAGVRAAFEKEKGKLGVAEKLTRGTTIEYEGHFTDGKKEYEVVTDAAGKVLKREPATKD